jgi:hypothetical protein
MFSIKRTYFSQPEGGDLGPLDPGYAVQIPGPPKAIDYLWQRGLESSPDQAQVSQSRSDRYSSN